MEVTRKQVPVNALFAFDSRVGPSYDKALAGIDSFMKFQTKYKPTAFDTGTENKSEDDSTSSADMHGWFYND